MSEVSPMQLFKRDVKMVSPEEALPGREDRAFEVSYESLLKTFFEEHDPTQGMRQGNDVGTQYRSAIYYMNEEQHRAAEMVREEYNRALEAAGKKPITTEIAPAGPFYYAEDYHQQYLHKGSNGDCGPQGTGVTCRIPVA